MHQEPPTPGTAEPSPRPNTPTPEDPRQREPIHDPPVHEEHDAKDEGEDKVLFDENESGR